MAHNQRLNAWYYLLRTTHTEDLMNENASEDLSMVLYKRGNTSVDFNNEDDAWLDESSSQLPLPTQLPLPF